ncbi:Uma2 family endonuclease [Streptomyces abikoensis]|uniref:Uma2 family endonuclease n=1 Tax=Streptomyces abikoensis TaxID=97398 RepID=UPI00368892A7
MTAPADESPPTLLDHFLTLEPPEGLRAELIEEQIFVTPAPDGDHEDHLSTLVRQVLRRSRTDMDCSANKGLKSYGIPDATFAPRERRLFRGAPTWMPCDGVSMVAEVTGANAHRDRVTKRRLYARADIPLYLLLDRDEETVTLFSEPVQGDYAETHSVPYGKPLPLPEPFGFDLETSDFA